MHLFFFDRLNKFSIKIYNYLILKYLKNTLNLLELNTNLSKFNLLKNEDFKTLTFNNNFKKTNINYLNFKLDLNSENACSIIKKNTFKLSDKFDNAIIFNCNMFFESENTFNNLLHILDYNIKQNGKCILSFLDIPNNYNKFFIKNNQLMYYLSYDLSSDLQEKTLKNVYAIKTFINGISNENNLSTFIINNDFFINKLNEKGYKCIEQDLWSNLYNLSVNQLKNEECLLDYEQDICKLYRYYVFEKIENTISSIIYETPKNNMFKETELELKSINNQTMTMTINEAQLNENYYKIKNTYDIFDILNCIPINVNYKFIIQNEPINNYQDIINLFNKLEKEHNFLYKPYLINQVPINSLKNHEKKFFICFYNYIYQEISIENSPEVSSEVSILYLILDNNKIITKNPSTINFKYNEKSNESKYNEKSNESKYNESKSNEKNKLKEKIRNEINNKSPTIAKIKEYLKELNYNEQDTKLKLKNDYLNKLNELLH